MLNGTSAEHEHLRDELAGHVIYDDPSVFHRLRVFEEDETTIDLCHSQLQTEMGPPIGELVRIADTASRIRADMKHGMDIDGSQKRSRKMQEQKMHKLFVCPVLYHRA